MRITMVAAHVLPHMGGIETHVGEVAPRLADMGHQVTVLTTDDAEGRVGVEERDGYRVERYRAYPKGRDYLLAPGIWEAIGREDSDLVHVQGAHTFVAPTAVAAARHYDVPAVLSFHTGGTSSSLRQALRSTQWSMQARLLRSVRRFIAVCNYEIETFSELLNCSPDRFDLVRNGCQALPVAPQPARQFDGDPLVVSLGRLERYKGHDRVIAAMPALLARAPGARLVVVGSGPYRDTLQSQVQDLVLDSKVSFASFASDERAELGALIARADVVALLSDYEAHPVAVMEAIGLGRPVLLADTSGLSELGHAGLADLIDAKANPAQIADALLDATHRQLTDAPRLGDWDDCAQSLADTYERALR